MKLILLTSILLGTFPLVGAQTSPAWERVYTFDTSIIEMNSELVTYGGKDIAHVRFRWTFDEPEGLNSDPHIKYKSQLEVLELQCTDKRYRPYEITYFDENEKPLRKEEMNPPGAWRQFGSSAIMDSLFTAGCELIGRKRNPPTLVVDRDEEKVVKFALSFFESLRRSKDFAPIIQTFFKADYLAGYLRDHETNWFLNLDPATAQAAGAAELQRFYTASLNANYLSSIYFISQSARIGSVPDRKLIPDDLIHFIDQHHYTAKYSRRQSNYDFIAENIDSLDRMREYTSLLEGIATLMRKHVIESRAEKSQPYLELLDEFSLESRTCTGECLGLPKGTKLFEIVMPIFHLQLAEVNNELKIVSLIDNFR